MLSIYIRIFTLNRLLILLIEVLKASIAVRLVSHQNLLRMIMLIVDSLHLHVLVVQSGPTDSENEFLISHGLRKLLMAVILVLDHVLLHTGTLECSVFVLLSLLLHLGHVCGVGCLSFLGLVHHSPE